MMPADALVEAVRAGSEVSVDSALQKHVKAIDKLNAVGVSSLQVSAWRNHLPILDKLLEAGASIDVQDLESGWTALHRVLYLGHLTAAAKLLSAGAHLNVPDFQGRTPLDLLSHELKCYLQFPSSSAFNPKIKPGHQSTPEHATLAAALTRTLNDPLSECRHLVFGWGSGANYQLGTGADDAYVTPTRIDALQHVNVVQVAASKYHSAAVSTSGQLYTWGWGRGGRLGHPDSLIHTKLSALLLPRLVAGLGKRFVLCVAAGKHHTLVCTSAGEVFAWGSNKHSCLGAPSSELDMQPTPQKVMSIQHKRIIAVAASNKHSAALTHKGDLYTWGANPDGQLGYATPDNADNPHPRLVENLKGRLLVAMSAAKRHTVSMTVDGEVFTWGYKYYTPRRVKLEGCRDTARGQSSMSSSSASTTPPHPQTSGPPTASSCTGYAASSTAHSHAPHTSHSSQHAVSHPAGVGRRQFSFHRGQSDVLRPIATAIAAGGVHSSVLVHTGEVLVWHSADTSLTVTEVGGQLAGKRVTYVSAGKTRTAAVTDHGDVYMWEGVLPRYKPEIVLSSTPGSSGRTDLSITPPIRSSSNSNLAGGADLAYNCNPSHPKVLSSSMGGTTGGIPTFGSTFGGTSAAMGGGSLGVVIQPERVPGLKRACAVAVGEKHSLALQSWSAPLLPSAVALHRTVSARSLEFLTGGDRDDSDMDSEGSESSGIESLDMDDEEGEREREGFRMESPGVSRLGPSWDWQRASWEREGNASSSYGAPAMLRDDLGYPFPYPPTPSSPPLPAPLLGGHPPSQGASAVPPLQDIMQIVVARDVVEPRSVLPILELADIIGAGMLRDYCMGVALRNLDAVILEARALLAAMPLRLLAELEGHYRQTFLRPPSPRNSLAVVGSSPRGPVPQREVSQPRAYSPHPGSSPLGVSFMDTVPQLLQGERRDTTRPRLQSSRRPTAAPAWLHNTHPSISPLLPSEQAAALAHAKQHFLSPSPAPASQHPATRDTTQNPPGSRGIEGEAAGELPGGADQDVVSEREQAVAEEQERRERMLRNLRKKLAQIDELKGRIDAGDVLDAQQLEKVGQGALTWQAVSMLEHGVAVVEVQHVLDTGKPASDPLSRLPAYNPPLGTGRIASYTRNPVEGASSSLNESPAGSRQGFQSLTQAGLADDVAASDAQLEGTADQTGPTHPSSSKLPTANTPPDPTPAFASTSGCTSTKSQTRKAARKGDLSEFLSGVLDKRRVEVEAAPANKCKAAASKGPAWGGAGVARVPLGPANNDGSRKAGRHWPGLSHPPDHPPPTDSPSPMPTHTPHISHPAHCHSSSTTTPTSTSFSSKPSKLCTTPPTPKSSIPLGPSPLVPTPRHPSSHPSKSTPLPNPTPNPSPSSSYPPPVTPPPRPNPSRPTTQPPPSALSLTPSRSAAQASSSILSLADFMKSNSRKTSKNKQSEAAVASSPSPRGPAWGGLGGGSPPTKSFMDILEEQKKQIQQTPIWWGTQAKGGSGVHGKQGAAGKGTAPLTHSSTTPPQSKWYVSSPTSVAAQALHNIQKEEAATQQLQSLYGGNVQVRVVTQREEQDKAGGHV